MSPYPRSSLLPFSPPFPVMAAAGAGSALCGADDDEFRLMSASTAAALLGTDAAGPKEEDSIQVVCRVRPLNSREASQQPGACGGSFLCRVCACFPVL